MANDLRNTDRSKTEAPSKTIYKSSAARARSAFDFNRRDILSEYTYALVENPQGTAVPSIERVEFVGLRFHKLEMVELLGEIRARIGFDRFAYVVTPNVDHLNQLKRDQDDALLQSAYADADLMVCDSRVLALLAKLSGVDLPAVPGSDVTAKILPSLKIGAKVAVVGGTSDIHDDLVGKYPDYQWQFHVPPMGVRFSRDIQNGIIDFVEEADADIIFMAFGAPQSEIVCRRIKQRARARGVAMCIGASLEFITETKKRAPMWMQQYGLEWLFRLMSEPRRLTRRYLVDGPVIFLSWRKWLKARKALAREGFGSNSSVSL